MNGWLIAGIIVGSIFLILLAIKLLTRKNNSGSGNIFDKASSVSSSFKECCMKMANKFGGGA